MNIHIRKMRDKGPFRRACHIYPNVVLYTNIFLIMIILCATIPFLEIGDSKDDYG